MIAVIYYAYGAPKSLDDVEPYFTHILNGKKVPAPMLNNIVGMFKKPGTPDFIRSSTERIAKGLSILLKDRVDEEVKVYTAYKHTAPFVADVYAEAVENGATTIVTLSVNPILSVSGGGAVHTEVAALNEGKSIEHIAINDYHLEPKIVDVYAERVTRAYNWLTATGKETGHVLFTVHSQPLDPAKNDPYVKQFGELAQAIADKAGIERFHTVYRSGKPAGWLAPDVKDVMRELAADGAKGFVTCELLSVTADVESYIEVNVECQEVAKELGVDFAVSEFLGDSFDLVYALSQLIEQRVSAKVTN